MNEMYWITRCDIILTISWVLLALSVVFIMLLIYGRIELLYEDEEDELGVKPFIKKYQKKVIIFALILVGIVTFMPSTRDAYIIYGVGGTLDYLQSNPTAKKLPDKCIVALDKFLDSISKDEKNK